MRVFLLLVVLLTAGVFAVNVYAFTGQHDWYNATAITSDGHEYKGEYKATGTFPIDGLLTDNSKVSLKGTLKVTQEDGVPVNKEYCLAIRAHSGKYDITRYTDVTCETGAEEKSYNLVYHTSNEMDYFFLKVYDQAGVTLQIAGQHEYTKTKRN